MIIFITGCRVVAMGLQAPMTRRICNPKKRSGPSAVQSNSRWVRGERKGPWVSGKKGCENLRGPCRGCGVAGRPGWSSDLWPASENVTGVYRSQCNCSNWDRKLMSPTASKLERRAAPVKGPSTSMTAGLTSKAGRRLGNKWCLLTGAQLSSTSTTSRQVPSGKLEESEAATTEVSSRPSFSDSEATMTDIVSYIAKLNTERGSSKSKSVATFHKFRKNTEYRWTMKRRQTLQ